MDLVDIATLAIALAYAGGLLFYDSWTSAAMDTFPPTDQLPGIKTGGFSRKPHG